MTAFLFQGVFVLTGAMCSAIVYGFSVPLPFVASFGRMEENTICYVKGKFSGPVQLLICLMTEKNISALHPFCIRVYEEYIELGRILYDGGFERFSGTYSKNGIVTYGLSDNDKNNFEIRIRKCYNDDYEVYFFQNGAWIIGGHRFKNRIAISHFSITGRLANPKVFFGGGEMRALLKTEYPEGHFKTNYFKVVILGYIRNSFSINLLSKSDDNPLLHVNPRYKDSHVYINCKNAHDWTSEHKVPWNKNECSENLCEIIIERRRGNPYRIAINRKDVYNKYEPGEGCKDASETNHIRIYETGIDMYDIQVFNDENSDFLQ